MPWSGVSPAAVQGKMAPITDDVITSLKDTVSALEKKVEDLEARLSGKGSGGSSASGGDMRMILMGMLFLTRIIRVPTG